LCFMSERGKNGIEVDRRRDGRGRGGGQDGAKDFRKPRGTITLSHYGGPENKEGREDKKLFTYIESKGFPVEGKNHVTVDSSRFDSRNKRNQ